MEGFRPVSLETQNPTKTPLKKHKTLLKTQNLNKNKLF